MTFNLRKNASFALSFILVLFLFTSCDKDNGGEGNEEVTSITLNSSAGTAFLVNTQTSLSVKDNNGQDVTSDSDIFVGGDKIDGATFTFDKAGSFEVYATYKELTSPKITIEVEEESNPSISEFTSKILAHEFTGTWCGFCAPALLELKEKEEKFSGNLIPVEVHGGGSGSGPGDKELFDFDNVNDFGVDGYPTLWYNFDSNFTYFADQDIQEYIEKKIKTGLAINFDLDNKNVTVRVKSDVDLNGSKLAVYLLEGKLTASQTNYENDNPSSPAYQKGEIIENFEYNNVARASLTSSALGDVISDATGSTLTTSFSLEGKTARVVEMANTKVVAFLVDKDGKYINAQVAVANQNKDFD